MESQTQILCSGSGALAVEMWDTEAPLFPAPAASLCTSLPRRDRLKWKNINQINPLMVLTLAFNRKPSFEFFFSSLYSSVSVPPAENTWYLPNDKDHEEFLYYDSPQVNLSSFILSKNIIRIKVIVFFSRPDQAVFENLRQIILIMGWKEKKAFCKLLM